MSLYIGIASYARPQAFRLCSLSLARTRIVQGIIAVIDARDENEKARYMEAIEEIRVHGIDVVLELSNKRSGSARARNRVFELAEQVLKDSDILVLYDDDYMCPGAHALMLVRTWLRDRGVGLVGGKVINLRKRNIDPDFNLNILPGLADTLTKLTGFIFLDAGHGPRYVDFTTPLMAVRVDVIKQDVRYDLNYRGTGYREESDLQLQVRKLGYRIVFDPHFYVYHLCLEEGGNRSVNSLAERFYWKSRNSTYFIKKHRLGTHKLVASTAIIATYAMLHGPKALEAVAKGLREGLIQYHLKEARPTFPYSS